MYAKANLFASFLPPFAPFNLFLHISRLHTFYIFVHSLFWPIFAERGQFSKHKYHIFNNLNKTHRNASFVTPFWPFLPPFNTSSEGFLERFGGIIYASQHAVATPLQHSQHTHTTSAAQAATQTRISTACITHPSNNKSPAHTN